MFEPGVNLDSEWIEKRIHSYNMINILVLIFFLEHKILDKKLIRLGQMRYTIRTTCEEIIQYKAYRYHSNFQKS